MIKTRKELFYYIEADRIALKIPEFNLKRKIKEYFSPHYIFRFQVNLRKTEYYRNKDKNLFEWILYAYYFFRYRRLSLKLGFTIPPNVFGPGLAIVHRGTVIVNGQAKVGKNCRIHADTNIGASSGSSKAPNLGDNIYIAPGVKIFGDITIASNTALAANAVVNKSIIEEGGVYGGVPAKYLGKAKIINYIKHVSPNDEELY